MKRRLKYTLFLLITVPLLLEALLWIAGFRPYRFTDFSISSEPENCLIADQKLGISLNPGQYLVTMNQDLQYKATHSSEHRRIHSTIKYDSSKKDLAIFGCSYTYGIGENDDKVLSAILSEKLSDYNVINMAVPSFGTVQGFLQLQELVESGKKPEVAIFNFADFHIERNVLSPQFRMHLRIGYERAMGDHKTNMNESKFPFVRWSGDSILVEYSEWPEIYSSLPGRNWSATINAIQTAKEVWQKRMLKPTESTIVLFELIKKYCDHNDIELLIGGITDHEDTKNVLESLKKKGIATLDMTLPIHDVEYNHLPYDTHPNAKAHKYYANQIFSYLQNHQVARK